MDSDFSRKKIITAIIQIILIAIFLFGYFQYIKMSTPPEPTDDSPVLTGDVMEDPGTQFEPPTDEEYYGDYGRDLTSEEKDYIYLFLETYKKPGYKELAEALAEYKVPEDLYFSDAYGNQVAPLSGNKPFMIYFANVFKDDFGEWAVDEVSNKMELLKVGASKDDPNLYIIPASEEISFEEFHKIMPDSDYIYSMDRVLTELYDIKGDNANVCMFFNADGTPAFVSINSNITKFQEYLPLVFNHEDLPLTDILSEISEISNSDNKEE